MKCKSLSNSFQLPYVKHIIFFEDPLKDVKDIASMISNGQVDVIPFREIVTKVRISLK